MNLSITRREARALSIPARVRSRTRAPARGATRGFLSTMIRPLVVSMTRTSSGLGVRHWLAAGATAGAGDAAGLGWAPAAPASSRPARRAGKAEDFIAPRLAGDRGPRKAARVSIPGRSG